MVQRNRDIEANDFKDLTELVNQRTKKKNKPEEKKFPIF
jgi:hypothetical protein